MPSKYLNKLQSASVLIVGGTSGIGYGVAEACVEHGASVVIASRSASKVSAAVERLKASYPEHASNIRGHVVDLNTRETDTEAQLIKLFDFATDNGARKLDHLVESAGDLSLAGKLKIETVSAEILAEATSVRLVGVVLLVKTALRYLNPSYTSSVTLTGGVLMLKPRPGFSPFLATAGGKEAFVKGLALDMAPVRVNLVHPGAIDTELLMSSMPQGMSKEAVIEMYSKGSVLNRVGSVEDIAEAYLAAMKSGFQTGTTVLVDGGYVLK